MGLQGNPGMNGAMGLQGDPGMTGPPGAAGTRVEPLAVMGTSMSTSVVNNCAPPPATVFLPANSHFHAGLNGYNVQQQTGFGLSGLGAVFTSFNPVDAGITDWLQDVYLVGTGVNVGSAFYDSPQSYSVLYFPDSGVGVSATAYPLAATVTYGPYVEVTYQGFLLDGTTTNAAYLSVSGSYACANTCPTGGTCAATAGGWITGFVVTQPDAGA